jgi:hypothetical protein
MRPVTARLFNITNNLQNVKNEKPKVINTRLNNVYFNDYIDYQFKPNNIVQHMSNINNFNTLNKKENKKVNIYLFI